MTYDDSELMGVVTPVRGAKSIIVQQPYKRHFEEECSVREGGKVKRDLSPCLWGVYQEI